MASYISNWAGTIVNPSINNTSTDLGQSIAYSVDWLNNGPAVNPASVGAIYDYMWGSFYGGGAFQMIGSGFTTSTPVITSLFVQTPQSWSFDFYGNLTIDVNTSDVYGYINHFVIHNPTGETIDVVCMSYSNSNDASISSITYQFSGGTIVIKGALTYHDLSNTVTGSLTSLAYSDNYGHGYQVTNLSVQYQQLGLYSDLDSFVAGVMSGNDVITGTANVDVLRGFGGNDTLNGSSGADTLVGGAGNDTMTGGTGNDTYSVDNVSDIVNENFGEGTDLIKSSISYTLGANFESLTLVGTAGINGIGNDGNNTLTGNVSNNALDGASGADKMIGGDGNDTYVVDDIGDIVSETNALVAGGIDQVQSSIDYSLGANIENLTLTGTNAISGMGNAFNNVIVGNSEDNSLNGGAGADVLNGGLGADTLIGGNGSDTYVVDNIGDVVIETNGLADGGIDLVKSSLSFDLSDNSNGNVKSYIEKLTLIGNATDGIGNTLANIITGNASNNMLDGGTGLDTLIGGLGDDTYFIDITSTGVLQDTVIEVSGAGVDTLILRSSAMLSTAITIVLDTALENFDASATGLTKLNLTGNTADNSLIGNAADNVLNGGAGFDALTGGAGNDIYVIDHLWDVVSENLDEGIDLIKVNIAAQSGTYALAECVENAKLINIVNYSITGNALNNVLTGNAAANTLIGDLGNDTLDGGAGIDALDGGDGNDIYVIDVAGDSISDSSGIDTVIAKLAAGTYALSSGLENLTLGGAASINGVGNSDGNTIIGNAGANILDGAGGIDSFIGGDGNDIYIVDSVDDLVTEANGLSAGGVDLVKSSVDWTLGANLENLKLTGIGSIGTGNALNNIIVGSIGDDLLAGLGGVDTLRGGQGNDGYIINLIKTGIVAVLQDTVVENVSEGAADGIFLATKDINDNLIDLGLTSAATLTLQVNVEGMFADGTGSNKLNITGNDLANWITGNDFGNVIDGSTGADLMVGGAGDDTYIVDNVGDIVDETDTNLHFFSMGTGVDTGGIDLVKINIAIAATSSNPYQLSANIENAILTNTVAYSLIGNTLNNVLTGNAAANTLLGDVGNDILKGGGGIDGLNGGEGDDKLVGGTGNDILIGGNGSDVFVFNSALSAITNKDVITDFVTGVDHIQLSAAIFTKLAGATNLADNFYDTSQGTQGANDFIVYNSLTGALYYDANGSAIGAGVQFATLTNTIVLTGLDLTLGA